MSPLLLSLVAATAWTTGPTSGEPRPLKRGDYAPTFLLKTMNPQASGMKVFSTKRFVGTGAAEPKKALLLNFAASYCAPCSKELPELKKVAETYADRGVMMAVVVIDREPEGRKAMRKLVEGLGLTSPVLADKWAIVGRRYQARTLPLSVVIGPDGRITWLRSGYRKDTVPAIRTALDKALVSTSR